MFLGAFPGVLLLFFLEPAELGLSRLRLLGEARAKALALTAMPLKAQQAADWGLIWQCLPDEQLMDEARKLAAPDASIGGEWHLPEGW